MARDEVTAKDVAAALRLSARKDLRDPDPARFRDLLDLARWERDLGLVEPAMVAALGLPKGHRFTLEEKAVWIREAWAPKQGVSPHPERWAELLEGTRALKERFLERRCEQLEACGSVWWSQLVVRLYWMDRYGRERLRRQIGIHRCKCAWCPFCGRTRQAQLSGEIEKVLVLLKDLGLTEGHCRLVTLTSPNGCDLAQLRDETHEAFGTLERSRWWNRHVFGFIRGTEVKVGQDGNWNFHIHLLVVCWSDRVSYQEIGKAWNDALTNLIGARPEGKRYVVDVVSLDSKRWARKDHQSGELKRKGSLIRAARYLTKYITKVEDLANIRNGPGGLAHFELSTHRLRRFAMGGGCTLVRRCAALLMPMHSLRAEELVNGTWLSDGRPPWRVELMDPCTGEVLPEPPLRPLKDEHGAALEAWGRALASDDVRAPAQWRLPPLVVGQPCGPRGRNRRMGSMPFAGRGVTVEAFEHGAAQVGLRALVAGGKWKVFRWSERSGKDGRLLHFACVLPARRYAWRPVLEAVRAALREGSWALLRERASVAGAAELVPLGTARISHLRSLHAEFGYLKRPWGSGSGSI